MSKVTLTTIQRDAFRQIAGTGTAKDAKEATIKALLRRNLIAPEGDGFTLTKAGLAFRALDVKEISAAAAEKSGSVKATKPTGVAKKAAKAAEDKAKREAAEADPAAGMNAALAGTGIRVEFEDAPKKSEVTVVDPIAASRTDKVVLAEQADELAAKRPAPAKTEKPAKAPVDKDGTIRLSKQFLRFLAVAPAGVVVKGDLTKKIDAATFAADESKRITITDADLDTLREWALAMASGETVERGDVRSARALVQWIDGMKARRAAKK